MYGRWAYLCKGAALSQSALQKPRSSLCRHLLVASALRMCRTLLLLPEQTLTTGSAASEVAFAALLIGKLTMSQGHMSACPAAALAGGAWARAWRLRLLLSAMLQAEPSITTLSF